MYLSIILWVKGGIVFQHNKIINTLKQNKMSFSLCTIQWLIPCVRVTASYCQHGAVPSSCLPRRRAAMGIGEGL